MKKMKDATLDKISIFLAELVGTGTLVFLGCMGCIKWESSLSHLQVILNFGFAVMIVIQIFGCVSGAHVNPAVTVAALVYRKVTITGACMYIVAQLLGGFMGFGLLKLVTPTEIFKPDANSTAPGLCTTMPREDLSGLQAVGIEFLATMLLILVCCGVWDPRNAKFHDSVALRFGIAVAGLACSFGPYTGGSMNPARSFGPAIWNGDFEMHWVYWIGPMLAAAVTAFTFKAVFWRDTKEDIKSEVHIPLNEYGKA